MKSQTSRQHPATLVASATPVHNRSANTERIDSGPAVQALVRRYQQRKKPISVNFRRMFPSLNSADRFTHLIHPYPAKLLFHIPYLFLSNDLLSKPGDIVLDPFCGSGTVLLEAQLANRRPYGADSNPLARLIARVKTTHFDCAALKRALSNLTKRLPPEPAGDRPDVVNLDHWFYPRTIKQLQCLHEAIEQMKASSTRDFFLVCFSVCVRKVSLADPRLSVPVRLKLGQYPQDHPLKEKSDAYLRNLRRVCVSEVFDRVTRANIARVEKTQVPPPACDITPNILCSDARHLAHEYSVNGQCGKPLEDESVQLIITSPPYPGAQKYIRSSSLSLGWLRLCRQSDLRAYKADTIGREEFTKAECGRVPRTDILKADKMLVSIGKRSPIRAVIAATYLNEMRAAIREMCRVLKPGGHVILVAANNRISGKDFRTADYLRTIAEECGLSLSACFVDAIRSRGLMTKRNHTASVITREWVLMFTKGELPQWNR